MRKFPDFASLARHFAGLPPHIEAAQHAELDRIGADIAHAAQMKIGEYQAQEGPFGAWAPLAPSTLADKARKGWSPPDNPLLRTGELRASYSHTTEGLTTVAGSPLDLAIWQELGTSRIPPRPVIGPALYEMLDRVVLRIIWATAKGASHA